MNAAIGAQLLSLVARNLKAPLGLGRYAFLFRLALRWQVYLARYADPEDDEGLREYKRKLVWFVMIYHELRPRLGDHEALRVALEVTRSVAVLVQRSLYRAPGNPSLSGLIVLHGRLRGKGLFRHIEYADVKVDHNRYEYRVTRCRFHEAFTAMGVPELTQAFCESDEIVFDGYARGLRFHRAGRGTIARGAEDCTFHFEQTMRATHSGGAVDVQCADLS